MDLDPYLQQFDIQKEDLSLRILNCSEHRIPTVLNPANIISIDPKLLPNLSFADQSFNLALCFDFLFENVTLTEAFHLAALLELARVAGEVRIYPLSDKQGRPSVHLGPILQALQQKGFGVELRQTKQSSALLRFWTESCIIQERTVSTDSRV